MSKPPVAPPSCLAFPPRQTPCRLTAEPIPSDTQHLLHSQCEQVGGLASDAYTSGWHSECKTSCVVGGESWLVPGRCGRRGGRRGGTEGWPAGRAGGGSVEQRECGAAR